MLTHYFQAGGPVMYVVFGAWVVVFAGVLDRCLYLLGCVRRRPMSAVARLIFAGEPANAQEALARENARASVGLSRIDAVSQIATSLGLFGTVLGIARSFFARGPDAGLAAPEVLSSALGTALFTTVAGLIVFLFGQGFLIAWQEWRSCCERKVEGLLEGTGGR